MQATSKTAPGTTGRSAKEKLGHGNGEGHLNYTNLRHGMQSLIFRGLMRFALLLADAGDALAHAVLHWEIGA